MRVALAQINPTLGAFAENRKKILSFILKSVERRCDVVLFPEACLFGYHPVDLLERPSVVAQQEKELKILAQKIPSGIVAIIGVIAKNPDKKGKPYLNAAALLQKGRRAKILAKELLPTYDVFDEGRHIEPGDVRKNIVSIKGKKVLVTICEDIWGWSNDQLRRPRYPTNPLKKLKASEVDIVLNLSASPFTEKKMAARMQVTRKTAKHFSAPLVYVNMVGAQDELIFDGGSFAIDKMGKVICQSLRFNEDLNVVDLVTKNGGFREVINDRNELRRRAIVLGIQDFVKKTGFQRVHLGLSGGVDSAVVACLAVDALGPFNVSCIAMPGPFSQPQSLTLAKKLAKNLNAQFFELPIQHIYDQVIDALKVGFGDFPFSTTNENVQARLRGLLLMAFSNLHQSMLLNTSNKSEFSMGYTTLYGDMSGGLSPIGDLLKTEVFELASHYNSQSELIPKEILSRPPSAELRPNQKDQDTLPPYEILDSAVEKLVENYRSPKSELDRRVLKSMMQSEFKRWQAPPILKVSDHAFGRGRRLPIAHQAIY